MFQLGAALILFVSVVTSSDAVTPVTCRFAESFTSQFVSISDIIVSGSDLAPNPAAGLPFLRDFLKFSEAEIEQATEDAVNFFSSRFGVDFSEAQPNEHGQRFLPEIGATFHVFAANPLLSSIVTFNRWIINGNERTLCFENRDGGFFVSFNSTQALFGAYGGETGLPITSGETLFYGYYHIAVCPQSPIIIQFQSATPARVDTVDGFGVINCDLFNRELGSGTAQGLYRATSVGENRFHYTYRNLYTFPGHPGLADTDNE